MVRMQADMGTCVCVGGHLVVVQVKVSQIFLFLVSWSPSDLEKLDRELLAMG